MPFRWFACIELFGAIQFDDIVRRLDGLSSGLFLHTIKVKGKTYIMPEFY